AVAAAVRSDSVETVGSAAPDRTRRGCLADSASRRTSFHLAAGRRLLRRFPRLCNYSSLAWPAYGRAAGKEIGRLDCRRTSAAGCLPENRRSQLPEGKRAPPPRCRNQDRAAPPTLEPGGEPGGNDAERSAASPRCQTLSRRREKRTSLSTRSGTSATGARPARRPFEG